MRRKLLYIAGSMTLCFSFLHLSFWAIFNWQEELLKISTINQGILQMLNIASIYRMLFIAFISFYLAKKADFSFIDRTLVIFFSGFYLLRVVFGIPLFGFSIQEIVIKFYCLVAASCYLLALRKK